MKKTIEYTINLELEKVKNLRKALEDLEGKLQRLQSERAKMEKSIRTAEERIAQIGLKTFSATTTKPVEAAEEKIKREEYNRTLQEEKTSYIRANFPEESSKGSTSETTSASKKSLIDLMKQFG